MNKILIVNTSTDQFHPYNKETGLWLSELVHFYDYFNKRGFDIDICNIDSGKTPIDPVSLGLFTMDRVTKKHYKSPLFMKLLNNSPSIEELDFSQYKVIYFTGGHGVMYDFRENPSINEAVNTIYDNGGIIASVCHGTSALLDVKKSNDEYFIKDRDITGFNNIEEKLANREDLVPYSLEDELKKHGAHYFKSKIPMTPFVITDGRIITGQNPVSAKAVAKAVYKELNNA